ncbi:MAG: hypothetical protein NT062_16920, partial [Proteobacteria bacterium]|nr:hypothetical protein [Pseudomonadota bacterium]
MIGRLLSCVLCVLLVFGPAHAYADTPMPTPTPTPIESGPEEALSQKIAVWRFDALGIEPELVARLETLFRMEL